jgi:hypothetical protein
MRRRFLLGFVMVLALGCGGQKFAPVSGVVTLNGKPLANASVSFIPESPKDATEALPASAGKTNEKGEYTLETMTGKTGALVGKHKVMISIQATEVQDRDTRPPKESRPRGGGPPMEEKIPTRYNSATTLTFDVPSGGTDQANFDLKSP